MSQGTAINNLGGGGNSMNDEDSRLVDSILNDLNNKPDGPPMGGPQGGGPQAGGPPQQISPEQHKVMLAQRQQAMMQQQMMMQQQQQQQMMMQQQQKNEENNNDPAESIIEKLQDGWKGILIVFILCVFVNMDTVDNLFKLDGNTMFLTETGGLNIQATIIKALAVAVIYFVAISFVPL